jgi:hypothetical protein
MRSTYSFETIRKGSLEFGGSIVAVATIAIIIGRGSG